MFGVKRLALFGSVARNEGTEQSDLDFVVEYKLRKYGFHSYFGLAVCLLEEGDAANSDAYKLVQVIETLLKSEN
ncbi:nucleotidyltransferase domain protein [Peptococcaceae bacterium CEB3]|nr:nucleotidyltransferase domain protein [Peptococcaceae bacterium CEB3]